MRIIDTSVDFPMSFVSGLFNLEMWKRYIDKWVIGAKELCINDMKECIDAGYSWEKDYLPVLNEVFTNTKKREEVIRSFHKVTKRLDEKITRIFGKTVDADVILYLGLCNGAGWVTKILGKTTVLLGIEKIIELDWCDIDDMMGLIIHELGHVYQDQYGVLTCDNKSMVDKFIWQLFTEGVAMVFEQKIVDNPDYFHQDRDGWKKWCDANFELIKNSFYSDLNSMTQESQRYFGDWVRFKGYPDVGYYLGTRFVRFLLENDCFDNIIKYRVERTKTEFDRFMNSNSFIS